MKYDYASFYGHFTESVDILRHLVFTRMILQVVYLIASTECDANIGAADVWIDTAQFLRMTEYDSADIQS